MVRRALGGMHRLTKEHFEITLTSVEHHHTLQSPSLHYWADPFLLEVDDTLWVFFEDYVALQDKGRICAIPLGNDLTPTASPVVVLEESWHLSFPFLFWIDRALYMMPESSNHKTIDLYICEQFPERWRRCHRIMSDIDAADSTLIVPNRENGLDAIWLLTSQRSRTADSNRKLALFSSDTIMASGWSAHPMNQRGLYGDQKFGTGRNAGTIACHNNHLVRLMQTSGAYYGEGTAWQHITKLTSTDYREEPATHPLPRVYEQIPTYAHHANVCRDTVAWDQRTRLPRLRQ